MRYRILEINDEGEWEPLTTVFESAGGVYYFSRARTDFQRIEGVHRLEDVLPDNLPLGLRDDERDSIRLTGVAEAWFPPHPIQQAVQETGLATLESEFVAENHFALLRRLTATS